MKDAPDWSFLITAGGSGSRLGGAALAQADQGQGAVGDLHPAAGQQTAEDVAVHRKVGDAAAACAVQVPVPGQGVVKAVGLPGDGHPPHPPGFHQAVQVAVDGAQAQAGALPEGGAVDLLGGGVVAQGPDLLQHQLPLF